MEIPVSRTKISLPTRRSDWVHRPRLLNLFYELLEYKLILVTAPAGYGKTTFMADMAHQIDIPTCWLSLDELDQEPIRFITHFIAAIATRYTGFGSQVIDEIHNHSDINLDHLTTSLANQVFEQIREHFLIVLDDYYLIEPKAFVREFISLFIQRTEENCHLALLTRKLPDLPDLTLLVGRTQVGGLSFRELAFTPEEIKTLVHQNFQDEINDETAHSLSEQTEGWVTGLLLSAQSRWNGVSNQMRVARASGIDLSAYLMAQVLNQQPDHLCYFLLQSSLLEEFNPQFCQRVLGEPPQNQSWMGLTGMVLEKNLFIQPLENGWLRYHHLFRDFLQKQAAQKYPDVYKNILTKLANIYAEEQAWEKSRAIFLRLNDYESVAHLIIEASQSLAKIGRYDTLISWIDALPSEIKAVSPELMSIMGISVVMTGNFDAGFTLLEQAKAIFLEKQDNQGLGQVFTRQGMAFFHISDYENAIKNAKNALALEDSLMHITKGEALRVFGLALWRTGDIHAAAVHLERAHLIYKSIDDRAREANLLTELGILYKAFGKFKKAEEAYLSSLDFWKNNKGFANAAYTANNLGVLYHFQGKYELAANCFEEAITFAHQTGNFKAEALAYCSLGDLYADLNIPETTRTTYATARQIAIQINNQFILLYLDLADAKMAHLNGETPYAYHVLDSISENTDTRNSAYEHALIQKIRGQIIIHKNPNDALTSFTHALNFFENGKQTHEAIILYFHIALAKHILKHNDAIHFMTKAVRQGELYGFPQEVVTSANYHKDLLKSFQENHQLTYLLQALFDRVIEFESNLTKLRRELRQQNMPIRIAPPKIAIQGLGANKVLINGVEITSSDWQTVRARDIFFFILENPKGVSREKIEANLWPEASSSQLKFTFKKTMYRLRRVFQKDPILFTGDRYTFDYQGDYEYDVENIEHQIHVMDRATDPTEKIHALETIVELYQGSYLPEIDGVWAIEKREYLARRYQEAMTMLGETALERKDFSKAVEYARRLLEVDSCNETAHRLAMRGYAGRGNRSKVAHQYKRCKQSLLNEHGLEPSEETVRLYKKLTG